jgi:sugar phosphate isomerase/epimerase
MDTRIISISAAPYDGYAFPRVLESLAACGARHVEPAFIVGYTEPFDETAFTPAQARQYAAWLRESGIGCHAFSSHIDLGTADAASVFMGRMDFAAELGARVINTNAAARSNSAGFFRNIHVLARHAERLGMIIGLENPGDGSDNLLNTAQDGIALIRQVGHASVRLNYDAGNTISHRPRQRPGGVDPAADALLAMPYCGHTHIKDVRVTDDGYFFVPLGQGDIDCAAIVRAVARTSLDLSIEIPLRLHRAPDARPRRAEAPVPLAEIELALKASLEFVRRNLVSGQPREAA